MRDELIALIGSYLGYGSPQSPMLADSILALLPDISNLEVAEYCQLRDFTKACPSNCGRCTNLIREYSDYEYQCATEGEIIRTPIKEEIEWVWTIAVQECISYEGRLLPSGGIMRIKK